MRYVITQDQFHNTVYKILNQNLGEVEKEINPYDKTGDTYRLNFYDQDGKEFLTYFYFPPGEDDDGNLHNGVGNLHINWKIDDMIRKLFTIRQTKVADIIADWVSETFDVDIDEVDIFPRKN
jgi:hypothetical protein